MCYHMECLLIILLSSFLSNEKFGCRYIALTIHHPSSHSIYDLIANSDDQTYTGEQYDNTQLSINLKVSLKRRLESSNGVRLSLDHKINIPMVIGNILVDPSVKTFHLRHLIICANWKQIFLRWL